MNTSNATQKWSAHGCAIHSGNFQVASTFIDDTGDALPSDADIERAALIVQAVNEYEALNEVAEAAKVILEDWVTLVGSDIEENKDVEAIFKKATSALANLNALRK